LHATLQPSYLSSAEAAAMAPKVEVVEIPYSKLVDGSCDISQEIIKVLNHVPRV
jgi:hypothetical protein